MNHFPYKRSFFILLSLLVLFWIWIGLSVYIKVTPLELLNRFSFTKSLSEVMSIIPTENSVLAIADNSNSITINFTKNMNRSYMDISHSLYTNKELNYTTIWDNNNRLNIKFDRKLILGESVSFSIRLKDINDKYLPIIEVSYE